MENVFDIDPKTEIKEIPFSMLPKDHQILYDFTLYNFRNYATSKADYKYAVFLARCNEDNHTLNLRQEEQFKLHIPKTALNNALKNFIVSARQNGNDIDLRLRPEIKADLDMKFKRTTRCSLEIIYLKVVICDD